MVPNTDGDDISYMTVTVDGPDGGVDPNVDPFILEAPMTYNSSMDRYEFILDNVGVNLEGRRLSIQTDEGGVSSRISAALSTEVVNTQAMIPTIIKRTTVTTPAHAPRKAPANITRASPILF